MTVWPEPWENHYMMVFAAAVFIVAFLAGCWALLFWSWKKGLFYWIAHDLFRSFYLLFFKRPKGPMHIMLAMADHFEPGNGGADPKRQRKRVSAWVENYPEAADAHLDADGVCVRHTFFFPPHYDTQDHLKRIVGLCAAGYGEVEFHLHHDRISPWPDDKATLAKKITDALKRYERWGVACLPDGKKAYAFIHGDWALANSLRKGRYCGVDQEIDVLLETGCFADFTFPISNEAQPRLTNTIFYAEKGRKGPKSYNRRPVLVEKGKKGRGLMLIQGVLGLRWASRTHRSYPSIEVSNLDSADHLFPERLDYLIKKHIHVPGKPEWTFVKLHLHGAREVDYDVFMGQSFHKAHSYLEKAYNDGRRYVLHYVSAREMYNIIKAAEAGLSGNPNDFRDFKIPRYVYLKPEKFPVS